MKIALDAGHGAKSGRPHTGAVANGLIEDELALDFTKRIGHHLRLVGHETVYTRPGSGIVGLLERPRTARAESCDLFLSVHCNAAHPKASGVEAFTTKGDKRSEVIAARLVDTVARHGMRNRGAKWDSQSAHKRLAVLRGAYRHMPAVLVEIGFLTNPGDAALLRDRCFREAVSKSIAAALAVDTNVQARLE